MCVKIEDAQEDAEENPREKTKEIVFKRYAVFIYKIIFYEIYKSHFNAQIHYQILILLIEI